MERRSIGYYPAAMRGFAQLVGRNAELSVLEGALRQALAGKGSVALIAGEPGIGKTRLAEAIAGRASASGARVAWGRCWEAGGAPAFWPWIQALRELLRDADDAWLGPLLSGRARGAAELLPELRRLAPAAVLAASDPEQARFELLDSVLALLGALAAREPLLLVLDDLHAADQSSLLLLDFVARSVGSSRILVAGTYRDVDARLARSGEVLAKIGRSSVASLLLRRLERNHVAELLAPEGLDDVAIAAIWKTSEGNPLFVSELARLGGASVLPDGISAAISEHLARLPAETRAVLETAAVIGREFQVDAVLAFGQNAERVSAALDEAARAGIAAEAEPGKWRFSHVLIRDVLAASVPAPRRAALHLRRAEALEAIHAADPQVAPASEVAHHFTEAGAASRERALAWHVRAAEEALARWAYDEAASSYAAALALVPPGSLERKGELCLALGGAQSRAGRVEEGKKACLEAADVARRLGSAELLARAGLEYGLLYTGGLTNPVLAGILEEALTRLGDGDSALRARALARRAAALQPSLDARVPIRMAQEAIAIARRIGDEETVLQVLVPAMSAMMDYVDASERLPLNEEHVRLARKRGDRYLELRGHLRLAFDHLELGGFAQHDAEVSRLAGMAGEMRQSSYRWIVEILRSCRALMTGRFAESAERIAAAEREAGDDPLAKRVLTLHRFGAARMRYDDRGIEQGVEDVRRTFGVEASGIVYADAMTAAALAWLEQEERQRAVASRLRVEEYHLIEDTMGGALIADALVAARDVDRIPKILPILRKREQRWSSWGFVGMIVYGPYAHPIGLCLAASGRWDEANRAFDTAIAAALAEGALPILARMRYEQTRLLAESPRADDRARAASRLDAAERDAAALGLEALSARLAKLRAAISRPASPAVPAAVAPAASPAAPAVPVALGFRMVLEGEVWSIESDAGAFRLKDSRGLRMLARLVEEPGRELHALDLDGLGEAADGGDAGEMLDEKARLAYKKRVEELREELEEAESFNDTARAERAQDELDAIASELSRAVGLGGRARRSGSAAERARVNVQRRLKDAIRRIGEQDPVLGKHLEWAVKTGTYCRYEPN